MANILNRRERIEQHSLEEMTSGTYRFGNKLISLRIENGLMHIKPIYDLDASANQSTQICTAMLGSLAEYMDEALLKLPEDREVSKGFMHIETMSMTSEHPVVVIIRHMVLPEGMLNVEEQIYRLDETWYGERSFPVWVLPYLKDGDTEKGIELFKIELLP